MIYIHDTWHRTAITMIVMIHGAYYHDTHHNACTVRNVIVNSNLRDNYYEDVCLLVDYNLRGGGTYFSFLKLISVQWSFNELWFPWMMIYQPTVRQNTSADRAEYKHASWMLINKPHQSKGKCVSDDVESLKHGCTYQLLPVSSCNGFELSMNSGLQGKLVDVKVWME